MKKTVLILALICLLIGSANLMAQDAEDEVRDVLELSFFSGFGLPGTDLGDWKGPLGASNGLLFGLDAGYFINSDLVVGFNFTYSSYGIDDTDGLSDQKHRFYNPALYMKYYYWGDGDFTPYVKGTLGIDNLKFTTLVEKLGEADASSRYRSLSYDPAMSASLAVGFFMYTSDYSGLFFDATYHYAYTRNSERQYNEQTLIFGVDASMIELHAGINVYFGSGD